SGRRLTSGELAKFATLAVRISRTFVRAFTDARLGEIEVVNLGADTTKELRRPFRRHKAEIVASNLKTAVECASGFPARQDSLAHCVPSSQSGTIHSQYSRLR